MARVCKIIASILSIAIAVCAFVLILRSGMDPHENSAPSTQPTVLGTEPTTPAPNVTVDFGPMPSDPWAEYPDGICIYTVPKQNFIATVMLIRDPSKVYLATSGNSFSLDKEGTRLPNQLRTEGAIAGINAGAFNDDGSSGKHVGSLPIGMVISEGEVLWDDGKSFYGFVGMTEEHKLYVADKITKEDVETYQIRDGCCFGPVLIKDGVVNENARDFMEGYNARTAIGQKADGTIVFLCIDGRQVGSIGATYSEFLDMVTELDVVNACGLDGGASTTMVYRDTYGRYGQAGKILQVNSYALIQENPRRMPTFFMVRPERGG